MWFAPSEEATATALRIHTAAALARPNAASIPKGPWPKPKPRLEAVLPQAKGVTVDDIIAILKAHPKGLTATEVQERLGGFLPGGINGPLKRRIARGDVEVIAKHGKRAIYRMAR